LTEQWSDEFAAGLREWCDKVASLGVDVLVHVGLIPKAEYEKATAIVAEEILVRLSLHDYPPRLGDESD
jgi:hypothetical protein